MTDLSGIVRWNANFVRGLAQSVLERAKVIRTSLGPATAKPVRKSKKVAAKKKPIVKRAKRSDA